MITHRKVELISRWTWPGVKIVIKGSCLDWNGFLPFIKIDLITVVIDSMAGDNWAHRWPIMNGGCSQNTNDDQCPNKMESLSMFALRG